MFAKYPNVPSKVFAYILLVLISGEILIIVVALKSKLLAELIKTLLAFREKSPVLLISKR